MRGKRLGCFCKPKACHGDVIAEYLDCKDSLDMMDRSMDDIREGRTRPAKPAIKKIIDELK